VDSSQPGLPDDGGTNRPPRQRCQGDLVRAVGQEWLRAAHRRAVVRDTTREPIRDETIGDGFIPVRAVIERKGLATTSSKGRYALEAGFAALFDPALSSDNFLTAATVWRAKHLSKTALARQALVASGALSSADAVHLRFPNGETRALSAGLRA